MLEFYGQEQCSIDASGRIKLTPTWQRNFARHTDGDVILQCVIPENCIRIYPPATWELVSDALLEGAGPTEDDILLRDQERLFGGMAHHTKISNQGRITLPPMFREEAKLSDEDSVLIVGIRRGLEVWQVAMWQERMARIRQHKQELAERRMQNELDKLLRQEE